MGKAKKCNTGCAIRRTLTEHLNDSGNAFDIDILLGNISKEGLNIEVKNIIVKAAEAIKTE